MLDADECARIVRALSAHQARCREIAGHAHDLGRGTIVSAMCREEAKAKQLSSKMVGMGTMAKNSKVHAALAVSHAAQRAEVHAAPTRPCDQSLAEVHAAESCCEALLRICEGCGFDGRHHKRATCANCGQIYK